MLKLMLLALSFLAPISWKAQEVVATQGDSYENSVGSMDWTIGEVVTATFMSLDVKAQLTQGFHQSNLTVVGQKDFGVDLGIRVFPNPATEHLTISTNSSGIRYQFIDMFGKQLSSAMVDAPETAIDVSSFANGVYLLILTDTGQGQLGTFKIHKTL